ncbi:MAG: DUF547 domain-containing protein [Magnetococcales bacterium]|nr:DUF547 domain-containing protein [Magnetococcales bacterium]
MRWRGCPATGRQGGRGRGGLCWGLLLLAGLIVPAVGLAEEPDWSGYAGLLQRHLTRNTVQGIELAWVDYAGLGGDPGFKALGQRLADFPVAQLADRREQLAFHINGYNVLAMGLVVDNHPLRSLKDLGNWLRPVWKRPAGRLGGREVTLHEVEHDILRRLGEPRIHAAIVCASLSCPDLRAEPFTAARLEEQLEDQMRRFLANPAKGLRMENGQVRVSRIFDWFAEDFGPLEPFLRRHRPDLPPGAPIAADLPYLWELNGN